MNSGRPSLLLEAEAIKLLGRPGLGLGEIRALATPYDVAALARDLEAAIPDRLCHIAPLVDNRVALGQFVAFW